MYTALENFRPALRIMLGDFDAVSRQYPDAALDDGVRTVMRLGKLPGFTLSPDLLAIDPEVRTANAYALITYHAVKLFVQSRPDRYSYKTRPMSESYGNSYRFLASLEADIHKLENGEMFLGYQTYFSWLSGTAGLPLYETLVQFDLHAPFWAVSLTRDGMRVASGTDSANAINDPAAASPV